jgi:acyl transferase domain-containing protein/NADPH:quinone reductase-like Zn-dependent oxidoreductase/NADP-dependent 3-hydroxy acid dehydrogenase YdfG/acyl carrier protein
VAGVIKMVQAMRHGVLPKTLHVEEPSEHIEWSAGEVSLLNEEVPWEPTGRPRRAGVSSFGISGTNAHLILEEAPEAKEQEHDAPGKGETPSLAVFEHGAKETPLAWPLSAKSETALRSQAESLAVHLASQPEQDPADIALSLSTRSAFEHRAVIVATDLEGFRAGLSALAQGAPAANVIVARATAKAKTAFLFPGQGSQWPGMAMELLESSPFFAEQMRACEEALAPHVDWSLEAVLRGAEGEPGLERVEVVQPALFAVMVSLAQMWRQMGAQPDAVIGHSQGEIAAAHIAGALSLDDAARVVALRAKALGELAGKGGMLSVALGAEAAAERLGAWDGRISLAAVNGPSAVVLSGEPEALAALLEELEAEEIRARMIPVDYAAHSAQVEAIRSELLEGCAPIEPQEAQVPFLSTVTAQPLDTTELDAEYWYRNLRETVRFEAVTELALSQGHRCFVELSPHPALLMSIQDSAERTLPEAERIAAVGSLRREDGGPERLLSSLAELWAGGGRIEWAKTLEGSGAKRVPLPTYSFQRERFWLSGARGSGDMSAVGQAPAEHPMLGAALALADGEGWLFTGRISLQTHPWLADHSVLGTVILPGTAFLELALHAGAHVGLGRVEELVMEAPLALAEQAAVQIQVSLGAPDEEGRRQVGVYSRAEQGLAEDLPEAEQWTRHASGALIAAEPPGPSELAGQWPPQDAEPIEIEGLYDRLAAAGFEYGPAFQGLTVAWKRGEEVFAEVSLSAEQVQAGDSFSLHPALFDAALHSAGAAWLAASEGEEESQGAAGVGLPFAWSGVSLNAPGASALRVALSPKGTESQEGEDSTPSGAISIALADQDGAPVASVASLTTRAVSESELLGAGASHYESLFRLEWVALEQKPKAQLSSEQSIPLLGSGESPLARALGQAGMGLSPHSELAALAQSEEVPGLLILDASEHPASEPPAAARDLLHGSLQAMQAWLAEERFADSRLIVLSRGAVAVRPGEEPTDLAAAPLWGLVRSAQSEHPDCFTLIDLDGEDASAQALAAILASLGDLGEPQLALRGGEALVPRLARAGSGHALQPPEGESRWRLETGGTGTLEDLLLVPSPQMAAPLEAGQVRVGVRAGGLNFRDVLITLGMYPEPAPIGSEGAGVILEVGAEVEGFAPGDRVMGLLVNAFGPVAVTDQRLIAKIPAGWSYAQAASVPTAFLTAYYALTDLAQLKSGERLLIHAAAGGVGMAATQIAKHIGAEVFATASEGKWGALEPLGVAGDRLASSRDLEFKERFLTASGGEGMDVVLDSLAREFVDASLELLPRGGRFIEMGKTDLRDPKEVAASHPDVAYRAFDLQEAGPERLGEILGEILALFEQGALEPLPLKVWDVRHAPDAFRFMREARHVGKNVLSVPQPIDPEGTALITGGTGVLGGFLARHLVAAHGISRLILVSRQGAQAPGAEELQAELEELGAEVKIAACDVADREQLEALIAAIDSDHPLKAVIHAAGTIDDGTIDSLSPERLDTVLSPKADAAWHLHELTEQMDLDAFVMFSSAAATVGAPGQGNYAAANTFLDALAAHRRAKGQPASSLAWGLWAELSALTGQADLSRMERAGVGGLSTEEGLELFDTAHNAEEPLMLPVRLDIAKLRAAARAGVLPPLLSGLVRAPTRRAVESGSFARRLVEAPEADREEVALELLRAHVAAVLGHSSAEAVDPQSAFKDLGFDSLAAVELRNRLNTATDLRLPATLVFDYPTPAALAGYLLKEVVGGESKAARGNTDLDKLEGTLTAMAPDDPERAAILARLRALVLNVEESESEEDGVSVAEKIESASDEEILEFLDAELGEPDGG